jgi:hypothetical protein
MRFWLLEEEQPRRGATASEPYPPRCSERDRDSRRRPRPPAGGCGTPSSPPRGGDLDVLVAVLDPEVVLLSPAPEYPSRRYSWGSAERIDRAETLSNRMNRANEQ